MSIILKALKKLQEENTKEVGEAGSSGQDRHLADAAASGDGAASPAIPGNEAHPEPASAHPAHKAAWEERASTHFGLGPKTLLVVVLILGIFTTGWFASRIYLGMRVPPPPAEHSPKRTVIADTASAPESQPTLKAADTPVEANQDSPVPTAVSGDSASAGNGAEDIVPTEKAPAEAPEQLSDPERAEERPATPTRVTDSSRRAAVSPPPKEPVLDSQGRPVLKINAIAWRGSEPKAIVNMQRVFEGDVIEGATVLAIQRKAILFEYEGKPFEVRF